MSYFVYIHECPNGKKYVGLTSQSVEQRWGVDGRRYQNNKGNNHFYRAIQKYGWDNIKHKVFEVDTESEMYYLEKYLIAYYQSNNPKYGYNKSTGGEHQSGWHHTDEMKVQISKSCTGWYHTDETRLRISMMKVGKPSWKKGTKISDDTKNKIRVSHYKQVMVDDIIFPSIEEAYKYVGGSRCGFQYAMNHSGIYKGHRINKIEK